MLTFAALLDLETDLNHARDKFLRQRGWTFSSDYPDCCWRWSKEIAGKRITGDAQQAIRVEQAISPDAE